MQNTQNTRVEHLKPLVSPALLVDEIPISQSASNLVSNTRQQISDIVHGKDQRMVVIVGPCSIHDPKAAIEYANKLKTLIERYQDTLCIIMRVYFEKPRTTVGWKGLINDPQLDNSFKINKGLRVARQLLLDINDLGIPTGSEFLDTIIPQYIADLTSWSAIGARTSESQIHRELASGLSMPVGFKNGTTGSIQIAVDAVYAASQPHRFLSVTTTGQAAIVTTTGNTDCHVILRGSSSGPNYDTESVQHTLKLLEARNLPAITMVDCSHGNSQKNHERQAQVVADIANYIKQGSTSILGVMIESNLHAGNQKLADPKQLEYGKSITDACIDWQTTEQLLHDLSQAVSQRNQS